MKQPVKPQAGKLLEQRMRQIRVLIEQITEASEADNARLPEKAEEILKSIAEHILESSDEYYHIMDALRRHAAEVMERAENLTRLADAMTIVEGAIADAIKAEMLKRQISLVEGREFAFVLGDRKPRIQVDEALFEREGGMYLIEVTEKKLDEKKFMEDVAAGVAIPGVTFEPQSELTTRAIKRPQPGPATFIGRIDPTYRKTGKKNHK